MKLTLVPLAVAFFSLSHFLSAADRVPFPAGSSVTDGFGVQLKGGARAGEENLDEIQKLGLRWVRRGFIWESVEKQKGVYDFEEYDKLVADCKQRGLNVIGCIAFSNKLYGHAKDPEGRAAYAAYAAALAEHFKNDPVVWEIWNEPNTKTFWGKHGKVGNSEPYAQEYYNLVAATVPEMKKANPKAFIMAGSVSGLWTESIKWMGYVFADGVLKTGIDGWSVHPYAFKCPEEYIQVYGDMRKQMEAAGGPADLTLINSERGYPIGKAEGYAGGDPALSQEYQAWHIVRQYLVDMYLGVGATIWYEWDGSEGFQIYAKDGEPKPAYNAAKVLIEQLKGYKLDKRLPLESDRDFVFQFTNAAGNVKLVAWMAQPAGTEPDKIVPHAVKIPVAASGQLATANIYGEKGTVEPKAGSIELTLKGAVQYVSVK